MLCGGADSIVLATGYDRLEAREGGYPYCRCTGCGLVSRKTSPAAEDIGALYPEAYPPHRTVAQRKPERLVNRLAIKYVYGVESLSRPWMWRLFARALCRRIMKNTQRPRGANRLLDVGCGAGRRLERYRRLGWKVCGIDISARAVEACRRTGLEVHHGTVFDAPYPAGTFDVVCLDHVIEHLLAPARVLERPAEFLAPRGKIVLTSPNSRGIGFLLYRSCWFHLDAPRHLFLFDPHTIRLLASQAGLLTRKVVTRSSPVSLCRSRHYAMTQGHTLPGDLAARRAVVERSARSRKPHRMYRRLVWPLTACCALFGRGDVLEAEFTIAGQAANR